MFTTHNHTTVTRTRVRRITGVAPRLVIVTAHTGPQTAHLNIVEIHLILAGHIQTAAIHNIIPDAIAAALTAKINHLDQAAADAQNNNPTRLLTHPLQQENCITICPYQDKAAVKKQNPSASYVGGNFS
jgi:hypothetical protein